MLIGEVSRRSGVSVRMLRHYDRVGLVSPSARSGAGYREYTAADLRRLFQAEALRSLGLSLAQAAEALDDPGFDAPEVIDGLRREAEERIARDRALLGRLDEIGSAEPESWEKVLEVVGLLSALRSGTARERQAAALRSGIDAPQVVPHLVEAYLAETELNAAGALRWAIAQAGQPAVGRLAARVRDPDARVRLRAVRALGDIDGAVADSALAEFIDDVDDEVASRAVLVLSARGGSGSGSRSPQPLSRLLPRLLTMIVSGSRDVEAAEALGALAARSADIEREIVAALAARLGGTGGDADPASRPDPASAPRPDPMSAHERPADPGLSADPASAPRPAPAVRSRITQALGELPGEAALALLRGLVSDPDPAVSRVARYLVGR